MAKEIIGSFILINQGYGILSSIYHNNMGTEPYPETAKRTSLVNGEVAFSFVGTYDTIWLEAGGHYRSRLEIEANASNTFSLKWIHTRKEETVFEGIGMLHDGKLIGCYWSS